VFAIVSQGSPIGLQEHHRSNNKDDQGGKEQEEYDEEKDNHEDTHEENIGRRGSRINMMNPRRIAFVHDWLVRMRGGEKCLEALCEVFPEAEIFTLLHKRGAVSPIIEGRPLHTSFLQFLPRARDRYQYFLPLYPAAIASLRPRGFDCVLSVSAAVSKAVRTPRTTLHICYCNTPMRYVWDQFDAYFGAGHAGLATRWAMKMLRGPLQRWDLRTAANPDFFIGNSENIRRRIERIYHRTADVIYPPVETGRFFLSARDDGFFLMVSALVPYKRVDIAVQAVKKTGERLVIIGDGSELERLQALAGPEVEFLGWRPDDEIREYYSACSAVLFPGEEDFGIVPVEAMATGKPVVAFAGGGALETVMEGPELQTGVLFHEQTVESLVEALRRVRAMHFEPSRMRAFALGFDREIYKEKMKTYILQKLEAFERGRSDLLKNRAKS
jgi:glycosyltransferase involved in cell wall biosynthesis